MAESIGFQSDFKQIYPGGCIIIMSQWHGNKKRGLPKSEISVIGYMYN